MKNTLLFTAALIVIGMVSRAEDLSAEDDIDLAPFHISYRGDVRSAYHSRAKIVEDRPLNVYDIRAEVELWDLGRLGTRYWGYSSLCNRRQDVHRRAFNEVDYAPYWNYALDLAEDWTLNNEVTCWWITLPGYREPYRGKTNNTQYEWWYEGSLANPYLVPSLLIRRGWQTAAWTYYKVGLSKPLTIDDRWTFTPALYTEHGCETLYHIRYGNPQRGRHYHSGIMAASPQFTLDWKYSKHLSFFALASELFSLNDKARDRIHTPNHRHYFLCQIGLKLSY